MALSNRNLFSHSSGGQKSEIQLLAGVPVREALSLPLPAPGRPRRSWVCRHSPSASASTTACSPTVCTWRFFLSAYQSYWIRAYLNDFIISTRLHLQGHYFQIRSHSKVLGVRMPTYLFKGRNSTHDRFRGVRRGPQGGSESPLCVQCLRSWRASDSCMHGIVLNTQTDQLFQTAEEEAKGHRGKLGPSPMLPCSHAAEWHCVVVGSSLQTPGSAGLGQLSFL